MAIEMAATIGGMARATKSIEPDQNAAMRVMVRRLVDVRFEGNRTKAAAAFGVSQPYLYEFLETENRGAGMKLLRGVAAYLHVGIDDVAAGRETPLEPPPAGRTLVYDEANEELVAAVAYCRGRYPDEYLRDFATINAKGERKSREEYRGDIETGYPKWRARGSATSKLPVRERVGPDPLDEPPPGAKPKKRK